MSFVPFDEFDQDCKFPHKSSRVVLANLNYVLPQATPLLLGGIRLGANLIYDSESGLVNVPIPVQSVNGTTGNVILDAGDIGADPSGTSATTMLNHLTVLNPHAQYSLETDVTNALALKVNNSAIGAPSGVAPLDENSNVPEQYLSFVQTGTGAVATTVQSKLQETVSVKDFGLACDGVTDDTLKFLSAAAYCRAGNKILKISGDILLKKTTVPVFSLISTYYVAGCSMVGEPNSRLTIEGKLGFDLSNVYETRVENVNVVTLNRESTESDLEATAPALFSSRYGTKNIAVYSNIKVANTLTDSTGTYRVGPVISEYGASIFNVRDVHVNGVTIAVNASTCATCFIQNIYTTNAQTGVVLTAPTSFSVSCVRLINTSVQYEHWVARTATPARAVNGMDAVLIESGGVGSIEDVYTEWPIERSVYAQAIELLLSDCYTLNGEGYKAVGYSRTTVLQACIISNCHVRLDDLYFVGTTRFRPPAFITYWSKNVYLTDCTATNSSNSNFNLECFLSVGRNAHTVKNIKITGCQADNANGLVYSSLFTSTTAQLTAIDPTQDFYVVDGITIRNTHIKKSQTPRNGTLIVQFDDFASTDARATYAVKNVSLYNNVIEYDAGGTRDTWTFDVRYVNTAKSINTAVNMAVSGSFFGAAITQPYASIYLDEPNLKSDAVAVIVSRLGNLNVLEGSKLKFTSTFGGDIVSTLDITAVVTGVLSSGHCKANIRGKGYYFWDGTMNCGISMCASGLQYFGRAVSGAKTDQVGTPPVGITVGASNIEVRGDLSPTIYYDMTLTLV